MSTTMVPRGVSPEGSMALATLGLPIALLLSSGMGVAMMAYGGCRHTSPTLGIVGGGLAVLSAGGCLTSFLGNWLRARRSRRLADQISIEVDDEERLEPMRRLAAKLNVPVPSLRAVVQETPLAFSLLDRSPSIVVSTWVFDQLTDDEWEALMAHELAHMRQGDRLYRWLGSLLQRILKGAPGTHQAWQRLDSAMEEAADRAAIDLLGTDAALASARRKFLEAGGSAPPDSHLIKALAPSSLRLRLALVGLGCVAALPLLPFLVVPYCVWLCSL